MAEGAVRFGVPGGEQFVPRLFAELGVPIKGVSVSRPTLDDAPRGRPARVQSSSESEGLLAPPVRREGGTISSLEGA